MPTGLRPWKCTPIPAFGGTSPGGGSLLSAYPCANLSRSLHNAARISPSGGDAATGGRRGAFPRPQGGCMVFQRAKRVWHVFPRAKTRLYGFIVPPLAEGKVVAPATKGGMHFSARQGGCKGFIQTGALYKLKGAHHGLCPQSGANTTLGPCVSTGPYAPLRPAAAGPYGNTAAPPTGIYWHLNHLRFLPRSFACAQDDGGRRAPSH